jgi:hypothetical protein
MVKDIEQFCRAELPLCTETVCTITMLLELPTMMLWIDQDLNRAPYLKYTK